MFIIIVPLVKFIRNLSPSQQVNAAPLVTEEIVYVGVVVQAVPPAEIVSGLELRQILVTRR